MGARAAVYALLVLVLLVLVELGIHDSGGPAAQDASIVFCTAAPARLDGLVNAAVDLGLAERGSVPAGIRAVDGEVLPYSRWRAVDNADFLRACDAYAAANRPVQTASGADGPGSATVLDILLPVIAGALLTLAADDVRQAAGRRWELADELRTEWRAFDAAVDSFVTECVKAQAAGDPRPPSGDVDEKRRALQAVLRKARSRYWRYRRSPVPARLLEALAEDADPLGPSRLGTGWNRGDRDEKVREFLGECRSSLEELAGKLERGIWLPFRR